MMGVRWIIFAVMVLAMAGAVNAGCGFDIAAKSTQALLNEVPTLDSSVKSCSPQIKSPLDMIFGTDKIELKIFMNGGTTERILFTIVDEKLTAVKRNPSETPDYVVTIGQCELDAVLASSNKIGAAAYAYKQKKLKISGVGFTNSFKLIFLKPIFSIAFGKLQTEIDMGCEKKALAENCQHGGECLSGNCIYVTGEGADRLYKCSCDPFKYKTMCAPEPDANLPNSGRKLGEICDHGGNCASGNCIYVTGEGAGRVYKCSCDPFKFQTMCAPAADAGLPDSGRKAGQVCDHGGNCETGNCIYVTGAGAGRVYKCSCDPFKFIGSGC